MCGLNVIYNSLGLGAQLTSVVEQMNHQMLYRGPDSQCTFHFGDVVFGHVRLSIVGLDNGSQPISNEDETLHIVCNGEIYNYLQLKQQLVNLGHHFKTATDNEVILHLYEEYGVHFLDYLVGMFAFVLWDSVKKELIIARDRLGEKPLYYAKTNLGLVISSEMKAIYNTVLSSASINKKYVQTVVEFSHSVSAKETLFNEISKVKPGHYIRSSGEVFEEVSYSYPSKRNINLVVKTSNSIFQNTYNLLSESVKRQLNVEVPVAIMLSGGIDSAAIASLSKLHREEVHAICVGYEGNYSSVDERNVARRFAKEKGLIWHEIQLNQKDYINYFEEYINVIDEPVADPAAFAQWGIFKKASELGFKVLLSGIGSDEFFYGYSGHNMLGDQMSNYDKLQKYFPIHHKNLYLYLVNYLFSNKENIKYISPLDFKNQFRTFKGFNKENYGSFFDGIRNIPVEILDIYASSENGVNRVYEYLSSSWLTNNCFLQSDKLAMGNSIEVRTPFADYNLNSYVKSIDFKSKYKQGKPKWFLKEVLKNELPDYILNPVKKGFSPPYNFIDELVKSKKYSSFFRKEYEHFNELVMDEILKKYQIF